MHDFELVKPVSIAEAVKALGAEGAQALSGGQTLLPTMKQRLAAPAVLVSLTGIAETRGVCMDAGALSVGGATTHAVVAAQARRITRRWPIWRAASATRRCETGAPLADRWPTTIRPPAIRRPCWGQGLRW
jgi:CO/xanthine dehydrogenase FAD-binding subunit